MVVLLGLWMLSGAFSASEQAENTSSDTQTPRISVEVTSAQSSVIAREINLQGQLEPKRSVQVKAQTSGQIQEIRSPKGARVAGGDDLIKLDEGGRGPSLSQAQAAVKLARSEQRAAQTLQRQRLQSQLQLEQADSALEAALAQQASVELDISHTTIQAPFAGVINALPAVEGALIERGDVIAELVDDSQFKVTARVSQHSLSQLSLGQSVSVELITGENLNGKLSFIGSVADPQSRSFNVEALVENNTQSIAAGVSATLSISVEEVMATFITPSTFSLGEEGELGVKAVDEQERVIFLPIELISSTLDGAWVTGIPDKSRVITLGQGFVNTGEQVETQTAAGS